jgi:hypothetical protein
MIRTHIITGLHNLQPKTNTVVPPQREIVGPYSVLTPLPNQRNVIVGRTQLKGYARVRLS